MSWKEHVSLLAEKDENWVLIVGAHLGASSGVPLPFTRTPWSPSITDLVQYHIFRTQSREISESVLKSLGGKAPLGFIADDLQGQIEWLRTYTDNISPQRTIVRLADLIKSQMFSGIISSAPDDLLEQALEMLDVDVQTLSLEQPKGDPEALTLFREWDDLIFQDTSDRRTREASFLRAQLEVLMEKADGVLLVGCHPYASDIMNNLVKISKKRPDTKIVWLEENLGEAIAEGTTVPQWFQKNRREQFSFLQVDDAYEFLNALAIARGIEPTPLIAAKEIEGGLSGLLNRSFDVKPILVYIPGMALFSGLLDKLPRISLKALLSLATLVLLLLGYLNYREYQGHSRNLEPTRGHLAVAKQYTKDGYPSYQNLVKAEKELDEGVKKSKKIPAPKASAISIPFLQTYMKHEISQLGEELTSLRSSKLIPALVRRRFTRQLTSSPLLRNMGHFPDVSVSVEQREQVDDQSDSKDKGKSSSSQSKSSKGPGFAATQQVRPFSVHKKKQYLALFARSSMLLRVVMRKEMLRDLKRGRLVIPVDLDEAENLSLESFVFRTLQKMSGYVSKRAALFQRGGLEQQLNKGNVTFYFLKLDTSGSVSKNLSRIATLLDRYPNCRGVVASYLHQTFKGISSEAPRFVRLKIEQYRQRQARLFLRANTSYSFFRGVMNNSYLRWNMTRPLIMSLLINYYRWVGEPPRSLGVIYDRLLRSMLREGSFGLTQQFKALGILAYLTLDKRKTDLPREKAFEAIASHNKISLERASKLLDELVKRGVMRYPSLTHVGFMDTNFQYICVSRHLRTLSFATRKPFLLRQHQKIMSFYAGIEPHLTKLVRSWLDDYQKVDAVLRSKGQHLNWINPYLPVLKYAALAVNNGKVKHRLVKKLEGLLFELIQHRRYGIIRNTVSWGLTHMSTPGVKQWILQGIEQDRAYSHRLFRLASMAPNDIYVGAVQRWMRRVRTDGDKQPRRRLSYESKLNTFQRIQVRRMARLSFGRALSFLVGLGSDDAIETAMTYARRTSDPRFDAGSWSVVRLFAIYMLMARGYFHTVSPLLAKLLQKEPHKWSFLVSRLYKVNNKRAAELLVGVLAKGGVLGKKAIVPSSVRKKMRKKLKVKAQAAKALSKLDEDLSVPLLLKAIQEKPSGAEDYRAYVALALGYIGQTKHLKHVEALIKATLAKSRPRNMPHWYRRRLIRVLNKAIALFGSKEAFALLGSLRSNATWRRLSGNTDYLYTYIKHANAESFFARRILCDSKVQRRFEKYRLLLRLAKMRSPSARRTINQLLQIRLGRKHTSLVRRICRSAKGFSFARYRKLSSIDDYVWALGRFQEPGDLPRFAQWALHSKRMVRRAAIVALGRYPTPEAGHALLESLKRFPQDKVRIVRTLGRQGIADNEQPLLQILAQEKANKKSKSTYLLSQTIRALGSTGRFSSLLQLFGWQAHRRLAGQASRALYRISYRIRGKHRSQAQLMAAVKGLKIPKIKPLPQAPVLASRAPQAAKRKRRRVSRRRTTRKKRKSFGGFGGFGKKKSGFGFK